MFELFLSNVKILSIIRVFSDVGEGERVYYPGFLNRYELIYVLDAQSTVHFQQVVMQDSPGVVRYLPKNVQGNEYAVDVIRTGECIAIYFDTNEPMPSLCQSVDFSKNAALKQLFIRIHRLWERKEPGYYHQCLSLFYDILAELETSAARRSPKAHRQKIEPGIERLLSHYCDPGFECRDLATLCGISYTYFKRLFIEEYGMPPRDYLAQLRLSKACELLSTQRYTVGQVADMCGYGNPYYFSRAFKQQMGMPPSEYGG